MQTDGWSVRALLGSLARDLRARLREEQAWGETHVPMSDPSAPRRPLPEIPALAPGPRAVGSSRPTPQHAGPSRGGHQEGPPRTAPPMPPVADRRPAAPSTGLPFDRMDDVPPGAEGLALVRERIGDDCRRCRLCEGRTNLVFGEGDPNADLMFIGEGPGFQEDQQGRPFVGPAGQLLDRMIGAMGFARTDVYIANVVKCRPPQNRDPEPDEQAACRPFIDAQIQAVQPKIIVTLGRIASQSLLETDLPLSRLRATFHEYPHLPIPVMPTYHPAGLLRNERWKRPTWEDLKQVMERLGKGPQGG